MAYEVRPRMHVFDCEKLACRAMSDIVKNGVSLELMISLRTSSMSETLS